MHFKINRSNKNAFETKKIEAIKCILRHEDMSFSKSCLPTSDNRHVLRK